MVLLTGSFRFVVYGVDFGRLPRYKVVRRFLLDPNGNRELLVHAMLVMDVEIPVLSLDQ